MARLRPDFTPTSLNSLFNEYYDSQERPGSSSGEDDGGRVLKSALQRKLDYDLSRPGGLDLNTAMALAAPAGQCELPDLGLTADMHTAKTELLLVEAVLHHHLHAKAITARGHFHVRRMFGRDDDPGPGSSLPVLGDNTIRSTYVPSSSRFLLMVWRQQRAESAGKWSAVLLPVPTSEACVALASELSALARATPGLTVNMGSATQHPFLQGEDLPAHQRYGGITKALHRLLLCLYHTRSGCEG